MSFRYRLSIMIMLVHHWEAGTGKWNEGDRWRPLKDIRGAIMYVGGNVHDSDGVTLRRNHPLASIHIYEPVPAFFAELVSYWKVNNLVATFHNYGLGFFNQTVFLSSNDTLGQSTFIMQSHSDGTNAFEVKDAASEFFRLNKKGPPVYLLHMNCEGCEWDFFESWILAGVFPHVPVIQYSLHYFPLDRPVSDVLSQYCRIHEALSKSHKLDFGPPFGWQRWTLL